MILISTWCIFHKCSHCGRIFQQAVCTFLFTVVTLCSKESQKTKYNAEWGLHSLPWYTSFWASPRFLYIINYQVEIIHNYALWTLLHWWQISYKNPLRGNPNANPYKVVLWYHLCLMMKHFMMGLVASMMTMFPFTGHEESLCESLSIFMSIILYFSNLNTYTHLNKQ